MAIPLRDNAPSYDTPYVTISLILINIGVFGLELMWPGGIPAFIEVWGETPTLILSGGNIPGTAIPAYWTWLTCTFTHFGVMHLLGNMVALWLFGDNLEWVCGRFRYLLFYLGCGVLSSAATTYLGYEGASAGAGASGAIAGVMAAYLLFYPRARVTSLMWIDPFSFMHWGTGTWGLVIRNISAWWYIGSWVLLQVLLGGFAMGAGVHENIGIYAHVAGAAVGAGLIWPAHIKARRPTAEHHSQSAELTDMLWGDEGDAGGSDTALTPEEELALWQHTPQGRLQARIDRLKEPFSDELADELIAQGDWAAARRHCADMLAIAQQEQDLDRCDGYRQLLREIGQQQPEVVSAAVVASSRPQRQEEVFVPQKADPFGLGEGVSRGTRRR